MAAVKRPKKGGGELQREEDETREELALEVAIAATQREEGGPNKKTRVPRKKASAPLKTASQI